MLEVYNDALREKESRIYTIHCFLRNFILCVLFLDLSCVQPSRAPLRQIKLRNLTLFLWAFLIKIVFSLCDRPATIRLRECSIFCGNYNWKSRESETRYFISVVCVCAWFCNSRRLIILTLCVRGKLTAYFDK